MRSYLEQGLPPLTIEDIQKIGLDHFKNFEHTKDKGNKVALQVTNEMMTYKDPVNELGSWLSLFSFYNRLSLNSELRQIIKQKIETDFKKFYQGKEVSPADFSVRSIIRAITFERGVLQTYLFFIGSEYLKLFPEEKKGVLGMFGGHTNQNAARALVEASNKYLGRQSWMKLYQIYNNLPSKKGALAKSIINIFEMYFHEPIEITAKALGLNSITNKDIEESIMPESLKLPQEAEEQLLRLQAEQLFQKHDANLNVVEDLGIFWVNRSPYLRIVVTGGATICAPVAVGLFLTANVYFLIGLGVVLGGGLFVLELIGHTGLKIESIPEDVLAALKGNHIALSLATKNLTHTAGEMAENLKFMGEITDKQREQLSNLTSENKQLTSQVQTLARVSKAFYSTLGDQKKLHETLSQLTSGTSETAKNVLLAESKYKQENDRLKSTVNDLRNQMDQLKSILVDFKGTKDELEKIALIYKGVLESAGVQEISTGPKSEYLKAVESLYPKEIQPTTSATVTVC